MRIGRFEIEQLSEGIFEVFKDGSFHKIDSKDITSRSTEEFSFRNSTKIGVDPILIRDGKHIIMLDSGLGWGLDSNSNYTDTSNLKTNLDIFGLTPSDVTHVVLSHLHFDHAAGCTYVDENSETQPTMPYANIFLQKKEWYYALSRLDKVNPVMGADYDLDEFYKLAALDKLVFITDSVFELVPGISLIRTGGHTPGHQIVKISDGGETAYFLGDLVPTEHHINHYAMKAMDIELLDAKKAKTILLKQAYEEKACLLFYHGIHSKAGRLMKDSNRNYVLKEVK